MIADEPVVIGTRTVQPGRQRRQDLAVVRYSDGTRHYLTAAPAVRHTCGGCGGGDLLTVLDLGSTPPANTLPADVDEPETWWPLRLAVCQSCWLAQQMGTVPDRQLYHAGYGFYSSASLPKVEYHRGLAARLLADYPEQATRLTVEVACNDGDLLRHFASAGCRTIGVDPAAGPAHLALERGLEVEVAPFTTLLAETLLAEHGPAGLLVANHVAAHVADLHDFFAAVDVLLHSDSGIAVVEVQYVVDLLVGNQIDHVYHEHRHHFSATSLARIAEGHGLHVWEVRHTPAQSGSISVVFGRAPRPGVLEGLWHSEKWLASPAAYHSLQPRAEYIRERLNELLEDETRAGRRVAGYAAPAKAATLLNWCHLGPDMIEFVCDSTPYKAGRYVPGTGIPVVGRRAAGGTTDLHAATTPDGRDAPDTWLLLAWNYAGDVLRRETVFTAAGGRWILPIPVPVLL